jgi:hypothetical protein
MTLLPGCVPAIHRGTAPPGVRGISRRSCGICCGFRGSYSFSVQHRQLFLGLGDGVLVGQDLPRDAGFLIRVYLRSSAFIGG